MDEAKNGESFVRFRAANGEIMVRSETYKSKSSAKSCIASIQQRVAEAPLDEAADAS
nr:YegP family protein [Peteryoungia ipomoeae]